VERRGDGAVDYPQVVLIAVSVALQRNKPECPFRIEVFRARK
jgi:hypothetical protein